MARLIRSDRAIFELKMGMEKYVEEREYMQDPFAHVLTRNPEESDQSLIKISTIKDVNKIHPNYPNMLEIIATNYVHGTPRVEVVGWDHDKDNRLDLLQIVRKQNKGWCNNRDWEDQQSYMMTFYRGPLELERNKKHGINVEYDGDYPKKFDTGYLIPNVGKKGFIMVPKEHDDIRQTFFMADLLNEHFPKAFEEQRELNDDVQRVLSDILFKSP